MKKKGLALWIALLVLLLLVICYVILIKQNEEEANLEENQKTSVLSVTSDEVVSVSFFLEDKEEIFVLENDEWSVSSDASFKVQGTMIDTLLSNVIEMSASRVLEDVDNLAEYGLDSPVQQMTITDKQGKTYTICWGSANSITGDDYCYVKEEGTVVYTVSYSVLQGFGTTLEEYRQTETTEE